MVWDVSAGNISTQDDTLRSPGSTQRSSIPTSPPAAPKSQRDSRKGGDRTGDHNRKSWSDVLRQSGPSGPSEPKVQWVKGLGLTTNMPSAKAVSSTTARRPATRKPEPDSQPPPLEDDSPPDLMYVTVGKKVNVAPQLEKMRKLCRNGENQGGKSSNQAAKTPSSPT